MILRLGALSVEVEDDRTVTTLHELVVACELPSAAIGQCSEKDAISQRKLRYGVDEVRRAYCVPCGRVPNKAAPG